MPQEGSGGGRLAQLFKECVEAVDEGRQVDLVEVCSADPDLIAPLRQRLKAYQALDDWASEMGPETVGAPAPKESQPALRDPRLVSQLELKRLTFHKPGGIADVYRAFDTTMERDVAVKVLRESGPLSQQNRDRFEREIKITGQLGHPGVVPIYSEGETMDGCPFYVMPFLTNGSLAHHIESLHSSGTQIGRNELRDLIGRLIAVCETVAYAHSRKVIHLDLKPANIMVGGYGETMVIDWGLANLVDLDQRFRMTGADSVVLSGSSPEEDEHVFQGTIYYASPEQLENREVGHKSDIFSLGVILYEILTGAPPLAHVPGVDSLAKARNRLIRGQFPPAREVKENAPAPLVSICGKAMSRKSSARYETAGEMADDLKRFLGDSRVHAHRESRLEKAARYGRRHWRLATSAVAVLMLLLGVLLLANINQAILRTQAETLRRQADSASHERMVVAADLAEMAGANEIDRRWALLEAAADSRAATVLLAKVAASPTDAAHWRELQEWLKDCYHDTIEKEVEVENWFLNYRDGVQIARYPPRDGHKNFAFRSYFHGGPSDYPEESITLSETDGGLRLPSFDGQLVMPTRHPVLSPFFVSRTDGRVKIAFSVPVWEYVDGRQSEQVVAVVGMSVSAGELKMFRRLGDVSLVPMLVDTRTYGWGTNSGAGLIIDHPKVPKREFAKGLSKSELDRAKDDWPRLPQSVLDKMLQPWKPGFPRKTVIIDQFATPVDQNSGPRKAACKRIVVPGRSGEFGRTGWYVVLQERAL